MIETIEANFQAAAELVALGLELAAVLMVAIGGIETAAASTRHFFSKQSTSWHRRQIWLRFASWILLSLEFALGADVVRTAIAPSWDDIGKLGAIAAIRTALSFFLERDIKETIEIPEADAVKTDS